MTDLTEQWEKGELPYAEYYIKLAGGEYTNDVWDFDGWQFFNKKGDVVVEVLAPVPSFEQWKMVYKTEFELLEQVVKLKELLKECQNMIAFKHEVYEEDALIKEIEEVLK